MKIQYRLLFLISSSLVLAQTTIKTEYKIGKAGNLYNGYGGIAIRVHYLKDGLLLKTMYFDKDSLPLLYRTHTIFNYDDKKRLISSQDYVKDKKMNWEYAYREVKYSKNQIELVFPNAKKNLDILEQSFAPPTKIIWSLDSLNRIIKMEFSNFKNESVAVQDLRITKEEFTYDALHKLIEIQTTFQSRLGDKIRYTVLEYKVNSKKPYVQKVTEDENKQIFDDVGYFYYSPKETDRYTITTTDRVSPDVFEKYGANAAHLSCLTYAEYGDPANKIANLTFESEIKIIWMKH